MPVILLGLVAFIGVAALVISGKSRQPPLPKPSPSKLKEGDGDLTPPPLIDAAAGVPGVAGGLPALSTVGLGAAAVLYTAANAYIGGKLTGDVTGTITGGVGGVYGNAGNVGRVVGKSLDQTLGGTGFGTTGIIAQGGGFVVGTAWAYVGWAAGISLGILTAFIWAVATVVTDLNRLAFGQKGALSEYDIHWQQAEEKFFSKLQASGEPLASLDAKGNFVLKYGPWANDDHVRRYSYPLADGYMRQCNRLAFKGWMRGTARGILSQSDADHCKFGAERGYFVGAYDPIQLAALKPAKEPWVRSWQPEFVAKITLAPQGTRQVSCEVVTGYRWKLVRKPLPFPELGEDYYQNQDAMPPEWVTPDMLVQPANVNASLVIQGPKYITGNFGQMVTVSDYWDTVLVPETMTVIGVEDALGANLMEAGARSANVEAWVKYMHESKGAFVSDYDHAIKGRDRGQFDGAIVTVDGAPVLQYADKLLWDDGVEVTETNNIGSVQP